MPPGALFVFHKQKTSLAVVSEGNWEKGSLEASAQRPVAGEAVELVSRTFLALLGDAWGTWCCWCAAARGACRACERVLCSPMRRRLLENTMGSRGAQHLDWGPRRLPRASPETEPQCAISQPPPPQRHRQNSFPDTPDCPFANSTGRSQTNTNKLIKIYL